MSPATAKIGAVHQHFDEVVRVDYIGGSRAYGVYFDYESDASGEFSVMSGVDSYESSTEKLEEVTLPAGKYLVFEGGGEMPQAVINTWQEIWTYFSNEEGEKRAYGVDYEFYKNQNEFEIYISI